MEVSTYTDPRGAESILIEDGRKCFDYVAELLSPSGEYKAAAGPWYINDEDSDEDGDEVENSEMLVVWNSDGIVYSVKGFDNIDPDDAKLFDDGRLFLWDGDETVTFFSADGKRTKKKLSISCEFQHGIEKDFAWFYGEGGESLDMKIQVFVFETMKSWTKKLHQDADLDAVFPSPTDGGVVVAERTDDKVLIVSKYSIHGEKQTCPPSDLRIAAGKRSADAAPPPSAGKVAGAFFKGVMSQLGKKRK